ncbi:MULTISPECIES: heavy metal sensor histidine kinase [Kushneria]|uniref:Sensor protein n=2 Tax=Kushneria TaxID=504090 RepID=A0A240UQ38_9GAMM|nr:MULTISPECIES: heavy metal sensor histidine kinase [Kushneria]ARS52500.1 two-component sensor histidine kinase [Kushneria konosiri]ART63183.1 two-component sensor histidine kinase [Kushneria marisflavi]RKD84206.1 two-component system heavy metal sensor histidine kinase CusS [Kushneria marisflavi]
MSRITGSLTLRLAFLFALVVGLLLSTIGLYLYHSLYSEITWRDDQMLRGRLERMIVLLDNSASVEALRHRPRLYANMLDNRESVLWVLTDDDRPIIEVNPMHQPVPELKGSDEVQLRTVLNGAPARLAWIDARLDGQQVTLIAGKRLTERNRMLASYRSKLWLSLAGGSLAAFLLGWIVTRRGLAPVRRLTARAATIDTQHLYYRLPEHSEVSELRDLSLALNGMLTRLEAGFLQLSRFSEDLAHEMRTPLTNLMGQTQQRLRHDRTGDEYKEILISNQEEFERLARMIDSMLFLARNEQPDASLDRQPIELHDMVDQLCEYFEGMAEERGMTLINRTHGRLDADPDLLRRALANLIANALRYGQTQTPIVIDQQQIDHLHHISVLNQGEPIPEAHLSLLFERFYRVDASRHTPGDSGGLGLAIVRSIAQLHGGLATVSNEHSGVRFTLCLPVSARS